MRSLFGLTVCGLFAAAAYAQQVEIGEGPLSSADLVGVYTIVSSENGGKEVPKERIDGTLVRFTETAIVATDTKQKEVYAATYELSKNVAPVRIHMISTLPTANGAKASGLIARDGETTKLIYRLPNGAEDPTDFKTKPGQIMVVMKRVKE